jgi:hypothetical protein
VGGNPTIEQEAESYEYTVPFNPSCHRWRRQRGRHLRLRPAAPRAGDRAGSIAMGLGGYLAARSDAEYYASERETEQREVNTIPAVETEEWVYQRPLYRRATDPQRDSDRADRRAGGRRGLWSSQRNFVMWSTAYECEW